MATKIPADAEITSLVKTDDKTVIHWLDHAGKSHRATKLHKPGTLDIVNPGDELWPVIVRRVSCIADAESQGRFELGLLANLVAPMGEIPSAHTGVKSNLEQLAKETGLAFETLDSYRKVYWAWQNHWQESGGIRIPPDVASWSVHQILMGQPDAPEALEKLISDGGGRATAASARKLVQDRHDDGCPNGCDQCATRRGLRKTPKPAAPGSKPPGNGLQECMKHLGKVTGSLTDAISSLHSYVQSRTINAEDAQLIVQGIEVIMDRAGEIRQIAEGSA